MVNFLFRDNWTFFRYLLRFRLYKQILVEVGVYRMGWVILSVHFIYGRGHRPLTSADVRKLVWLPVRVISKCRQYVLSFRHKPRVWQTDWRTELRSRDENVSKWQYLIYLNIFCPETQTRKLISENHNLLTETIFAIKALLNTARHSSRQRNAKQTLGWRQITVKPILQPYTRTAYSHAGSLVNTDW